MMKNSSFVENSNNPSGNTSGSNVKTNISVAGKCAICAAPSKSKCSNCAQIYYCSVNHQKQDWRRHKQECHPFIIKSNEMLGRYLVAARDINPDEIVLKETPLVYGSGAPKNFVCVGCMKQVNKSDFLKCEHCGWPICERKCQNCPDHRAECEYFIKMQRNKLNCQDCESISQHSVVLRCLLLKITNPKKWERLNQLQSHQELKNLEKEKLYLLHAQFLKTIFKGNEWSEDEIIKIRRIIDINSYGIPLDEPSYVGIFDYASLFEHSCNPNLDIVLTDKNEIILWSPYKIKKGTNLSVTYLDDKWETVRRQQHLKSTKFFKCECERCKDVTEFGTFYNALRCNIKNCDGMVLPLSLETFDEDWKCKKCLEVIKKSYVSEILSNAEREFEVLDNNPDHCIRYINDHTKYLSKQHYLICKAKMWCVEFAGVQEVSSLYNKDQLSIMLQFCKEMIEFYEKLAPVGIIKVVGSLYSKLFCISIENSKRTSDKETIECYLKEALKYIGNAIKKLQYSSTIQSGKLAEARIKSLLSEGKF